MSNKISAKSFEIRGQNGTRKWVVEVVSSHVVQQGHSIRQAVVPGGTWGQVSSSLVMFAIKAT